MKVTIKSITTPNIVGYIADFARVSRNRDEVETTPEQDLTLCKRLWKDNERTAFESINIDFLIEDVSRSLLAQITRYRHATFMVKSQRYVKLGKDDEFILPDLSYIKKGNNRERCYDIFGGVSDVIKDRYSDLIFLGAKPEDARAILMNATPTRFRIVCNLRSFLNFYQQRTDVHAQKEIHNLACEMFYQILNFQVDKNGQDLLSFITDSMAHSLKDLIKEIKKLDHEGAQEDLYEYIMDIIKEYEGYI